MPNKRLRQTKKFSPEEFVVDRFKMISRAVYERLTSEEKSIPSSRNILAMEIAKENNLIDLAPDEKNFLWSCLECVGGGEELTEDDFFAVACAYANGNGQGAV